VRTTRRSFSSGRPSAVPAHARRRRWVLALLAVGALAAIALVGLRPMRDRQSRHRAAPVVSASPTTASVVAPSHALPPRPARGGLTGTVVDDDGQPVSAAVVRFTGQPDRATDSAGRFAIRALAAGGYSLTATTATAASVPLAIRIDDEPQDVTVRLHPGVSLAVEVVSVADGRPVPAARGLLAVSTSLGEAGHLAAIADERGILRFPVAAIGNYHVSVEADGFAPATRLLVENARAGLAWDAQIALEPGVVLTGQVVDEGGAPIADAEVRSRPPPRAQTQLAYRPRPPELLRPAVRTDADGRFRYPVPVGQGLVLVADHPRFVTGTSAVIARAEAAEVTITLRAGRQLVGRVVDRDRHPVAGVEVGDGPPEPTAAHHARTGDDGRFVLTGLDPSLPQVVLFASTRSARANPMLVALPAGLDREIELVLEHELRIAGTVVDGTGPVADAVITFQRALPADYRLPVAAPTATVEAAILGEARADGAGAFVIPGLAPGDYQLLVRQPGVTARRASPPIMARVVATAGATDVKVVLPAPGAVRGRVVTSDGKPATGVAVSLLHFGGAQRSTAPDGSFLIEQIDPGPGDYTLEIASAEGLPINVDATVTAGHTTDLGTITLERGRILRGQVIDTGSGGPVANAWLSVDGPDGDQVANARSDELGRFTVMVPTDPVVVHAVATSVGSSRFELVSSNRHDVVLRLPETGRLEVVVADLGPADAVTVTATRTDAADGGFRLWMLERVAGTDGFRAEVSPGPYLVHAARGRSLAGTNRSKGGLAVAVTAGAVQRVTVALESPLASAAP